MAENPMTSCRGCGAEIEAVAVTCPQCGAVRRGGDGPSKSGVVVDNKVAWALAFAPLVGHFMQFLVAYVVSGSGYQAEMALKENDYWYITIFLNIGLSFWDEKKLEKAGCDTGKFKGMVWLAPVYLYQRARALQHNLAYFIVWLLCFAITLF